MDHSISKSSRLRRGARRFFLDVLESTYIYSNDIDTYYEGQHASTMFNDGITLIEGH